MVSVPQEPEVALAQRLAANERPVRTRALKTLAKYISLRSRTTAGGFGKDDLLKIWKGLFYSLWMQDKPDLQEELSDQVSGLIHKFHTFDNQLLYFETFLQTVKREWNGIDRLRMDKFFQLVRFVFRQVFEVLRRREWDSSLVDQFLEVFTVELLQSAGRVPDGLMLHILELYMTELAGVGSAELSAEQNLTFIQPFCKTISETKDRSVLSSVCKKIFSTILDHAPYAVEELMKELSNGGEDSGAGEEEDEEEDVEEGETRRRTQRKAKEMKVNGVPGVESGDEDSDYDLMDMENEDPEDAGEDDDDDDDVGPVLQFDYGSIADRLFELGSRPTTPNFNRAKIYKLVKTFRDLSEGIFPQDDDVDAAAKLKGPSLKKNKKQKKGKKEVQTDDQSPAKKRKACEDELELIELDQDEEPSSENIKKKKKDGAETEQSAETQQDRLETPVETEETPKAKNKKERLAVVVDKETQSQSQDNKGLHSEPSGRKKRQGSKLSAGRTGQEAAAAECDTDHQLTNTDNKIRRCLAAEMLEVDSVSLQTTAPPIGRKKGDKKSKKILDEGLSTNCRGQTLTDVQHENDISVSSPVQKKKTQKSVTDDEVIIISEETQDPNMPSFSKMSFTNKQPEGVVPKKKKKKAKDVDKTVENNVKIIIIPEESGTAGDVTDTTSAAVTSWSTKVGDLQSDAVTSTKKKKNKKQKVKGLAAQIHDPAEVAIKGFKVCTNKPTGKSCAHTAEEEEAQCEADAPGDAEAAGTVQTPTRKKNSQKKSKKQLLQLIEDVNEEILLSDCTKEHVLKNRKQKQKAERESTPPTQTKKKRKIQADEVEISQINGQTVKEDLEISTSVKSKKKLKTTSSQSDFASFQSQTAAPTPLLCRVKPKGRSRTGASILKSFLKTDGKKVTFGLKNNKTTEFRMTDQSLLVSPVGSSRVAFDPEKKPASGVLKPPSTSPFSSLKKATPKKRPTAADFF